MTYSIVQKQRFADSLRGAWKRLALVYPVVRNPLLWALPLQAALSFWRLDLLDAWGDEGFTLATVREPLREIASIVGNEKCTRCGQSPLYYFLLHFWMRFPWPGSWLAQARAMSVVWALAATVLFYALWLRREAPGFQRLVLGLWVLSPCLLLYARMARSYTMQLALGLLAIYAAIRWTRELRNWRWFTAYAACCAAVLYTHYVPGFAITGAVSLILIVRKRAAALAASEQ